MEERHNPFERDPWTGDRPTHSEVDSEIADAHVKDADEVKRGTPENPEINPIEQADE